MGILNKVFKGAGKLASEAVSQSQKSVYRQSQKSGQKIAGKTIQEWDREWRYVGTLSRINLTDFNKYVGLYKATLAGEVVYIGRAIEWNNGGFRKRLSDYRRESNSARMHESGQKMYQYRDDLSIELLIIGSNEQAAKVTSTIEGMMVGKYAPSWNKVRNF
ncbi:hypothetical protein [Radiobacillus sp. PE A8.2]|uniref:hypothetical protein n=1 Tax=Radiobacillus sp. PE A8.2 TaxID=3380349 RepID=UPI00388E3F56